MKKVSDFSVIYIALPDSPHALERKGMKNSQKPSRSHCKVSLKRRNQSVLNQHTKNLYKVG